MDIATSFEPIKLSNPYTSPLPASNVSGIIGAPSVGPSLVGGSILSVKPPATSTFWTNVNNVLATTAQVAQVLAPKSSAPGASTVTVQTPSTPNSSPVVIPSGLGQILPLLGIGQGSTSNTQASQSSGGGFNLNMNVVLIGAAAIFLIVLLARKRG